MNGIETSYHAINRLQDQRSPDDVLAVLGTISADYGAKYFVITGLPLPGRRLAPLIMAKHWPKGWLERYSHKNYEAVDPCAHKCFSSFEPFLWTDAPLKRGVEERSRRVMHDASAFGMRDGLTVPIHTEEGYTAAVSFAGEQLDLPPQSIELLQMSAYIAHGHVIPTCIDHH